MNFNRVELNEMAAQVKVLKILVKGGRKKLRK